MTSSRQTWHQSDVVHVLENDTDAPVFGIGSIVAIWREEVFRVVEVEGAWFVGEPLTIAETNWLLGKSGLMLSIAASGGGITGAANLFTESGCSAFIDEFRVPCSHASFRTLCRKDLAEKWSHVTEEAASLLAKGMLLAMAPTEKRKIGVGLTAKLTMPGERQGREHLAYLTATDGFVTYNAVFTPTGDERALQEAALAVWVRTQLLLLIAHFSAKAEPVKAPTPEAPWQLPNGQSITGWSEQLPGVYRIEIHSGPGIYHTVCSPSLVSRGG